MKKITVFYLLFSILLFVQCKKDGGSNSNSNQNAAGTGKFSFAGQTYTGLCVATTAAGIGNGGLDAGIVADNGNTFSIGNLSAASSGTTTFGDGWSQLQGSTFGVLNANNSTVLLASKAGSGTITKTGAKTFTFSCTVYDILSTSQYTVTGSGNYK